MRRAVLTLAGTAAGIAALLSFKTHSDTPAANAAAASATTPAAGMGAASGASPAASATRSAKSHSSRTGKAASSTRTPQAGQTSAPAMQTSAAATQTRTVTGTVANTQKGPMQVEITLAGTKITKVTVLQQTDDGPESNQIDSFAIPKLESETLAAQSASIDAVSGASYTSSGYIQSLQSAIDQARA